MDKTHIRILSGVTILILTISIWSYGNDVDYIRERGELVVATRNAPTTYYEIRDRYAGLEYELAEGFAKHLGVETRYIVKATIEQVFDEVANRQADIAAAGLTKTEDRSDRFIFSDSYQEVKQQVVCRRGGAKPDNKDDLASVDIIVPSKSSYVEVLQELSQSVVRLQWKEEDERDTESLLESVSKGQHDCTVADSNIVAINRRYYPELDIRFDLTQPQSLVWVFNPESSELRNEFDDWLDEIKSTGQLQQLLQKYYGFIEIFDYVDISIYQRRIRNRLPKYKKIFENVAEEYGFPWTLVAAQAYQESHWNPHSKSPTGVRGMMMLTRSTAKELKVKNRLDARQSVRGGVKYLSRLVKQLPNDIRYPDRTWFALAAYNVGMGHIHDARSLARKMGKSPSLWKDIKEVLPLLSQKKYYSDLKYGYARGSEPVDYVQRVRDYRDILEQALKK